MKHILFVFTESFCPRGLSAYSLGIIKAVDAFPEYKISFLFQPSRIRELEDELPLSIKKYSYSVGTNKVQKLLNKFVYPFALKKAINELLNKEEIDFIHFLAPEYQAQPLLRKLSNKATVVYTVHDAVHHPFEKNLLRFIINGIIHHRIKRSINISKNLFTNSYDNKAFLERKYPSKKIFYAPMPTHISENVATGNLVPSELKNEDGYILFFGGLWLYKGLDILVNGYKKSAAYGKKKLVISGSGPFYTPEFEDKNILFLNRFVENEELRSLFKKATCVVYPYTSVTQTAVLQYPYFFRVPVIASDLNYFRNNIVDGISGFLFKNKDSDDLAQKINSCFMANFNREKMTDAQEKMYAELYSLDHLGIELKKMYDELG